MSTLFLIGDGPLAEEVAAAARDAGHEVIALLDPTLLAVAPGDPTPFEEENRELWAEARRADLILDAVVSNRDAKRRAVIEAAGWAQGPILTTTLNASATEVAFWQGEAERIAGWAALPPLAEARVVQLAAPLGASGLALAAAESFFHSLGKEPVTVGDSVGGVLPRVVANLVNEAAFALMEGVAEAADIDRAMQLGTNYPRGPLAWADLIGLDQVVAIIEALGSEFGHDRYRPAPLLRQLVRAGRLGRRSGQGFYQYALDSAPTSAYPSPQ
ncbi:MAG TPA: 3-hydroxyacyl-CoA dehydrogenase family protein [Ardenticatenaceae bacterium]|nr:3-hydroxyacyl-CoA dehydrogenase family protein [Ardenticatenaceae bacterium]